MKTAEQMIMENIDLHYRDYSQGEIEDIAMLMRKFAYQAINQAANKAEADVVWLNDEPPLTTTPDDQHGAYDKIDERYLQAGDQRFIQKELDFEVAIIRNSIYQIKDEIK